VRRWVGELPDWLHGLFVCDVEAVMFCSKLRYSLLSGGLFVLSAMFALGLLASSVGVPYVWTAVAVAFLPVTGYFCLGVSPTCFPMVPTCSGRLLIDFLDSVIPARIELPLALQVTPGCIDTNVSAALCVVPCSAAPFGFVSWEQPLAWGACEAALCPALHNALREWPLFRNPGDLFYDFSAALYRSHLVHAEADADVQNAFRFCAATTAHRVLPLGLLIGTLAYVIPALLTIPVQFALGTLQLVLAALPMAHTRTRE
jgi:hypothetical protein